MNSWFDDLYVDVDFCWHYAHTSWLRATRLEIPKQSFMIRISQEDWFLETLSRLAHFVGPGCLKRYNCLETFSCQNTFTSFSLYCNFNLLWDVEFYFGFCNSQFFLKMLKNFPQLMHPTIRCMYSRFLAENESKLQHYLKWKKMLTELNFLLRWSSNNFLSFFRFMKIEESLHSCNILACTSMS